MLAVSIDTPRAEGEPVLPGDELVLTVDAHDDGALASVIVRMSTTDAALEPSFVLKAPANGVSTTRISVPDTWGSGDYRILKVTVTDTAGYSSAYNRNGAIGVWPRVAGAATTHDLDLTAVEFTVTGGPERTPRSHTVALDAHLRLSVLAPGIQLVARPGKLGLISTSGWTERGAMTGYLVTAEPSGFRTVVPARASDVPVQDVSLAIPGLPNGVTQSVTVTALSPAGDSPAVRATARPELGAR